MALIKCHECGKKVSTESSACPACGAAVKIPPPKSARKISKVYWVGLIVLVGGIGFLSKKEPQSPERTAAADRQWRMHFDQVQVATVGAQKILQSARNPKSVTWSKILANDDASVICYELRAENGFGGMSIEQVAFINSALTTADGPWNKSCARKPLDNVTSDVVKALERL